MLRASCCGLIQSRVLAAASTGRGRTSRRAARTQARPLARAPPRQRPCPHHETAAAASAENQARAWSASPSSREIECCDALVRSVAATRHHKDRNSVNAQMGSICGYEGRHMAWWICWTGELSSAWAKPFLVGGERDANADGGRDHAQVLYGWQQRRPERRRRRRARQQRRQQPPASGR